MWLFKVGQDLHLQFCFDWAHDQVAKMDQVRMHEFDNLTIRTKSKPGAKNMNHSTKICQYAISQTLHMCVKNLRVFY